MNSQTGSGNAVDTALRSRCLRSVQKMEFSWSLGFDGGLGLNVESPWRLVSSGQLVVGSGDGDAAESELREALFNRRVRHAHAAPITADLEIEFEGDLTFRTLSDSSRYEAWTLGGPGLTIVGRAFD